MDWSSHGISRWVWLDVARAALLGDPQQASAATVGRLAAARYFFRYELPKIAAWLKVVETRDRTCADLAEDAF